MTRSLTRRALLRGLGGAAIALPFLDDLMPTAAAATPTTDRFITMFFGLGILKDQQSADLSNPNNPLSNYARHASKMTLFNNVDMSTPAMLQAPHVHGGLMSGCGVPPVSSEVAGGASIDQFVKTQCYTEGVPTRIDTLAAAFYLDRTGSEHFRCRDSFGAPAAAVKNRPSELFEAMFGTPPGAGADDRERRARRSVLDAVIEHYRHYTQDRGGLTSTNRLRLQQHLDGIRQLERRIYGEIPAECGTPTAPSEPNLPYATENGVGEGHTASLAQIDTVFETIADLFVLGLRCDLTRFGNLMLEPAGAHTTWRGTYEQDGFSFDFDSTNNAIHHYYHGTNGPVTRAYAHFVQSRLARVLDRMDDPAFPEADGGTLLDGTTVLISTEVGTNHDHDGVFHAVAGRGDAFAHGSVVERRVHAAEIYRTVTQTLGIQAPFASDDLVSSEVTELQP